MKLKRTRSVTTNISIIHKVPNVLYVVQIALIFLFYFATAQKENRDYTSMKRYYF